MKILLVRHGESTANVEGILSSLPSDEVSLTKNGRIQVENAKKYIVGKIDSLYVSPLLRTIETADILFDDKKNKPNTIIIDSRISEINYGKFSGHANNIELDNVRESQVAGDYNVRFGEYGENKLDIMLRLYDFLIDIIETNPSSAKIVIVSHGSIVGWLERIILSLEESKIQRKHISNAEIRKYVLFKRDAKKLNRHRLVDKCLALSKDYLAVYKYRQLYIRIANLYDDEEIDFYTLEQFLKGLFESDVKAIQRAIDINETISDDAIAVCVMHNSAILVEEYIKHYIKIGVSKFVIIDNNSDDNSIDIIREFNDKTIQIDIWQTSDRFDGFKAMGWKQRMFYFYGLNKWYFNLDIDELAVFINCEKLTVNDLIRYAKKHNLLSIGGMLVDMYSDKPILKDGLLNDGVLLEYKFFDYCSYTSSFSKKFFYKIVGGPRNRLFNRHPSLQKFPLAYVGFDTIAINPHFWYPYETNNRSDRLLGLLHYKFLPGDFEKYSMYVKSGVHWNNSSQYRSYVDYLLKNPEASFFDNTQSIKYKDSMSLTAIKDKNNQSLIKPMSND